MVTHNMHQALELGNRTLMMDSGRIVFDVKGEERSRMTVDDLLEKFRENAGKNLDIKVRRALDKIDLQRLRVAGRKSIAANFRKQVWRCAHDVGHSYGKRRSDNDSSDIYRTEI